LIITVPTILVLAGNIYGICRLFIFYLFFMIYCSDIHIIHER